MSSLYIHDITDNTENDESEESTEMLAKHERQKDYFNKIIKLYVNLSYAVKD